METRQIKKIPYIENGNQYILPFEAKEVGKIAELYQIRFVPIKVINLNVRCSKCGKEIEYGDREHDCNPIDLTDHRIKL